MMIDYDSDDDTNQRPNNQNVQQVLFYQTNNDLQAEEPREEPRTKPRSKPRAKVGTKQGTPKYVARNRHMSQTIGNVKKE